MKRLLKTILLTALTACMALGIALLAACTSDGGSENPPPTGTVEYTVTVLCSDEEVLETAKVHLFQGNGESAAPAQQLEDGKAVFNLPPETYSVVLSDIKHYDYVPVTLTSENRSATIALFEPPVPPGPVLVTSFNAPYLGNWVSLTLNQDGEPLYRVNIEKGAFYFNGERLAVYTDGNRLYFSTGSFVYTQLTPCELIEKCLVLASYQETGSTSVFLVPAGGLTRVHVPADLEGTWTNGEESFSFLDTTFSMGGEDGYVVSYKETREGATIIAVLGEGFCTMQYRAAERTVTVAGRDTPFTQSDADTEGDALYL